MLVFLHQLISLTLPVCGLVLIQSCTVGLLVLCCPTCSGRRRRRSSPPSSGSWCCQRREPHRPQRCVGRPCRGCRQTWQRWRSHRAAWWLLRKAVSPLRCLRSMKERFKNTHKLQLLYWNTNSLSWCKRVRWSYCACVLTEVARQTARSILDCKGGAVLHVCAGLGRIIFVVKHWQRNKKGDKMLYLRLE